MQPFCSVFILQVVFLWIFPCHWTSTSTFLVFPVDICPKNETEVKEASGKLNCSIGYNETKNEYHCVPVSNLTQLVEFCYPKTSGLIEKGLCMVLSETTLDARKCHKFNDGCPNIHYTSEMMYQFPVCSLINKESKCYLADPACLSLWQPSSTPRLKTTTNRNTPMDTGTTTMITVIGIFTPLSLLVLSAFAYFMFRRRRMKNENGGIEEMENLHNEGESGDTHIPLEDSSSVIMKDEKNEKRPNLKLPTPPECMICRGATVKIECSGIPEDVQEIKWFKDGTPMKTSSSEVGILKLANLDPTNDGKYWCEITQSPGTKISSNEVNITIKDEQPIALSTLGDLQIEGAELEIKCKSSIPTPTEVCWYKENEEIVDKGRFLNGTCQNPSLTISTLKLTDSGTYRCKITNNFGFAECTLDIDVKERPNLKLPTPPECMICRGATVKIECSGIPEDVQEIKWFKDGTPMKTSSSEVGILKLANLDPTNDGKYWCEITQSPGTKISSNEVNITIKDEQPIALSTLGDLQIEGAELEIKCKSSIPTPTEVCWYKENEEIVDKGRFLNGTCQNPSLTISTLKLTDSGTYRCKITNNFGFAECTLDIDVKEQPNFTNAVGNLITKDELPKMLDGFRHFVSSTQRTCLLSITNDGCRKLSNPNITVVKGRTNNPLTSIDEGKAGIFIFTTENTGASCIVQFQSIPLCKVKITNSDQSHNSYKQYKIDSWANTDPWTHQRWDQVPKRSKHPLLTGHTRREPHILIR
ncbi:titin-like isoform X2 [Ostrea edulis]|uniref:titin-like isoform X2 n=1 Tax=Ostrea edulis TaxID=37623 RepID=UPI0024AF1A42|nr:titin-like isoform X2 [Ostrea edulis]